LAELNKGGTPWHADHIAERYSLFAIIALGEGVVGTVAAMSAVVERQGWTLDASLVCIAGVGLTFGMWWVYYLLPSAHALRSHRNRAFVWGFAQILIVISIVATGAGFRVAAQFIEQKARVGSFDVVLSVAIPVSVFLGSIYALHAFLSRKAVLQQFWSLVPALAGCGKRPNFGVSRDS
jgi:low temperature requirement protein LtrA